MNYQAFNNNSLTMCTKPCAGRWRPMTQDQETFFRVRETPEWKKHAAALEAEILKRGMSFEVIDWSEDRAKPPSEV